MRARSVLLCSLILATIAPAQSTITPFKAEAVSPPASAFEEKVLATVPETYGKLETYNVIILPDGKTFGYLAPHNSGYAAIYNGKEVVDGLDRPGPMENPGGGVLFYGKRNGQCVLVLNDTVHETPCPGYYGLGGAYMRYLAISPNGEHWACVQQDGREGLLTVDGKKFGPFEAFLEPPVIDNDGKVMVGGKLYGGGAWNSFLTGTSVGVHVMALGSISAMAFAPDGKTLLYLVQRGDDLILFEGETVGREYKGMRAPAEHLAISADGRSIAFTAMRSASREGYCVMVDDHCGEVFDSILTPPQFVADTHDVFYEARTTDGKSFVIVGDRKYANPTGVVGRPHHVVVSANGKTVANYWNLSQTLYTNDGRVVPMNEGHVVVNGVGRKAKGLVNSVALSPDGESLAYVAQLPEGGAAVVRGEQTGEKFNGIDSLTFSPNSKALAYVARTVTEKSMVVLNGRKSGVFDAVLTPLLFSPDSSKLAFGALRGREILWKVMATTTASAPGARTSPAPKQGGPKPGSSRPGSAPAR